MNDRIRNALIAAAAALGAVLVGHAVAQEAYFWPSLLLFTALAATLVRLFGLPLDTIAIGLITFGYLAGNRGFAQFMLIPGFPLLPAEAVLFAAGGWAFIACARERRLPWTTDLLHVCVLAWLILGTARIAFDVQLYGFEAARDFATVYYAGFFFLTRRIAGQSPTARAYLVGCVAAGCAVLPPLAVLYSIFPDFFHGTLRVNNIPVLLYKGDLALMFSAVSAVLLFHCASGRYRIWAWPYAVVLFLVVIARDSRASIVGSLLVLGLLAAGRRWLYPLVQAGAVLLALVVVWFLATVVRNEWAEQRLDTVGAHLASVIDPVRAVNRVADEGAYKWDNNRFRLIWWRTVAQTTWETSPLLGQGFGRDLAHEFTREYFPEAVIDFTARSPHNIALTAFGRMGLAGVTVWLLLVGAIVARTWQTIRRAPEPREWGLWGGVLVILVTAHFQVVLEGPMGAVPFWVLLGLATTPAHSVDESATATLPQDRETASA